MSKISKEEFLEQEGVKEKLQEVANNHGFTVEELLNVIQKESNFDTSAKNPKSSATGLIQFMPKTAKGLGTSIDEISGMNTVDQLNLVDTYFKQNHTKGQHPYITIAYPKAAGMGMDDVIAKSGDSIAAQNPVWQNEEGNVTKRSILGYAGYTEDVEGAIPGVVEETTEEDVKKLTANEKLFNKLFEDKRYNKSYEDFQKQFSTPSAQENLYKAMKKDKLYTKDPGEFLNTFFPIPNEVDSTEIKEETSQPDIVVTEEVTASTGEESSTESQDNLLTDTIMGASYQVSEEGIASGKKNKEAARNFFSTKKSKLEQALEDIDIVVPLTKKDIASVDTDLQLAQSPKIKELEAKLKEAPSMSQEAADILKEIESIKSATTESRVNPRNKSYQKNIDVVTQHEDKVTEITNRVVSDGGDENEVKKQVDFYEKNNPEQTRVNTANYEVETINRALDNFETATSDNTYSSFSEDEDEKKELNNLVEQQIIEDLSIKEMGKAAEDNYDLPEKEAIILAAKDKVLRAEFEKANEVYNSAVVVDFVKEKNDLEAQLKAMSKYDDEGLLIPFANQVEVDKYNGLVNKLNGLQEKGESVKEIVLSAQERLSTLSTELGFNAVKGIFDNNFEMTDNYQKWRDEYVKERGSWGGAYDAVGTLVQGGVNIAADATLGFGVSIAGMMDNAVNEDNKYYTGHDMVQDTYKNFANFNWAGTSDYGADILDKDGNYTINARSTTKTIANMLPFTIGNILAMRRGDLKPMKGMWSTIGPKFMTSAKGRGAIRMMDASYRMTINDNYHDGLALGLDKSQAHAYANMLSFGTGLSQMIMPDANFLGSNAGKIILKGFVNNLKSATTKKAIGVATKQGFINLGKELGEEEIELGFSDIAKYSVGLAHSPDILDLRTQKETIAATLMLSGSLGSIGTVNDIKNAKKQVYQQYKDNGQDIIDVLDDNLKVANAKFENARTQKSKDNHQATIDQINDAKNYGQSIINAVNSAPENVSDDQIDLLIQKQELVKQKQGKDKAISVGIDNQIKEIDEKISNSVIKQGEKAQTEKNIATVKQAIKKGGLDGNVSEMTSEEISNTKEEGFDSKSAAGQFGFIKQKTDGSFEIVLNKDKPMVGVESHEFMHAVLFKTVGSNTEIQDNLGDALVDHVVNNLEGDKSILGKRLSAYGEYNKEGEFIRDDNFGEETITIMSESIVNGSLKFDENFFTKVGDVIRRFSQNYLGKEITFDTGRDVYNFVKDYSKNVKDGKINKAILRVAKEGAKGKLVEGKVEAKASVQASKEASDKVQSIYEEQGEAGAFEIIEQFKPIVSRIAERRREAPNFDKELLMSEIEIGERGILDLISKYDPDSGVPLAAYINKFLPSRAIEASRRVLGEEFTEDISERVDIAAEEVEVETTTKPKKKKTILSDRLAVKSKVDKVIEAKLPELDIENLNFKTLKDQTPEITGEMFGISPKKLISSANITKKELQSAQMFISKNSDVLLAMLPEGATTGGTATGVPNTLLKPFYTKTGRAKMEKTGTKAGLAVQVKNDNISKNDFLEVFGIVDGVPNRTDRNTSARVLALANQTGKMMTNQAVREQLLKQGKPLQSMGHLADGKSTIMFSKDEQVNQKSVQLLGNMDRSLSPEGRTLFWDDISAFANENILDRNLESIKIGLRNVYGSVPEINKNIDELAVAIHSAIKNVKDPIVKNPIKLVDKLLEINNRQLSKVKEYFNSDTTAADAFRDEQRVKNFVATTSVLSNKLFDPKNPGRSIAKILMMKGHLASSARNSHLDRKQPLPGNPEFLNATLGSIPGVEFKTNKSKDGKIALDKNSITYNGEPVSLETVTSAQSSQSALNDAKDVGKLNKRNEAEDVAQELLDDITDFYTELYNNGEIDNVDLQMVSASLLSNMDAVLARAAKLKYVSDDAYSFKNPGKEVKYEHMQPRVAVLLSMWDAKINGGGITDIKDFLKNYTIQVIPNTMDKVITESKLGESLYVGQTLAMPSWIRTYNDATKENDKGRLRPLVDVYTKKVLEPSAAFVKGIRILKPQLKENKILNNAIVEGRIMASKPARGITVLDFDDTLATSKSLIRFTKPDGTKGTLNAEQYASTYEELTELGYKWDFSEFNKVVGGKIAPLFQKALKLQGKFGPENMFVLTARPMEAASAIFTFLKANGLNIPLKNITGLGNSTAEAKALWMADKVAEGYNDFYFADDALQNVKAVDNMLEQFDVKRKVQQARIKFSKSMNEGFNDILENVTGINSEKRFSDIKARKRGAEKGKFRIFIPPSHEDFVGLLYNFMGKGKEGNAHRDFFEQALVRPLNRAYKEIDTAKQAVANDYKALNKEFKNVKDKLIKNTPDGDFTFQDAIRVYLWNKHGYKIPGLNTTDQQNLVELVSQDAELKAYAETLNVISKQDKYVDPGPNWNTGNIRIDLVDATGRVGRKAYFAEFNENAEALFSEENLNKIEAAYGSNFRSALEDMLHRIKTGVNRPKGASAKPNMFMNWLNASVAGVMFFNTRSALLQQMSNVNYLNFADNNIYAAGKAFANQPQYWKDFAMIFNSDMMKQRRGGLGTDINGAELAEAIKKARPGNIFDQVAIITGKALKLGFLPTQIGDNIAIATGGAAFYRNRVNKYIKDGMSIKDAGAAAFTDFQNITQSTQQSARPDMTSQQQASWIGKLVLNFLNTPSQYNRIIKKAGSDMLNRRITPPNTTQTQSDMSNMSRVLYYGAVQNLIFYSLQTALFAVAFGGEDDDEKTEQFLKKKERVINGTIDTILRGSGIYGVAVSTLKNMTIKFLEQREKSYNKDESAVLMEGLNFSPVLGIKARRIVNAEKTLNYNKKVIAEMETLDIDNPVWSAVTNIIQATTGAPVNKILSKITNLRNAMDAKYTAFQRVLFLSGYTTWSLGLGDTEKMEEIKEVVKEKSKIKSKEKAKVKREEKKKVDLKEKEVEGIEKQKKEKKEGKQVTCLVCKLPIESDKKYCTVHEKTEKRKDGKEVQCRKRKKDGKRCGMKTTSKSGYCYYHD